jgi:hypothetical protein
MGCLPHVVATSSARLVSNARSTLPPADGWPTTPHHCVAPRARSVTPTCALPVRLQIGSLPHLGTLSRAAQRAWLVTPTRTLPLEPTLLLYYNLLTFQAACNDGAVQLSDGGLALCVRASRFALCLTPHLSPRTACLDHCLRLRLQGREGWLLSYVNRHSHIVYCPFSCLTGTASCARLRRHMLCMSRCYLPPKLCESILIHLSGSTAHRVTALKCQYSGDILNYALNPLQAHPPSN